MEGSITEWICELADGDAEAAQRIWERYFDRLVGVARQRLRTSPRRVADEEDVALSAFNSFCQAAADHRFPQLNDRDDLWSLLVTITIRKANAQLKKEYRQKRGGGAVRGESAFHNAGSGSGIGLAGFADNEPTAELGATLSETYEQLLKSLDDEMLEQIALLKLEGYTHEEIAEKLDCTVRTVTRKLQRIRNKWEKAMDG